MVKIVYKNEVKDWDCLVMRWFRFFCFFDGYMCIDTRRENEIRWLPYENCAGFEMYDEFNEESLPVFKNFDEYINCYFCGIKHEIEDDDEY